MPKENRQRGRLQNKKRKRDEYEKGKIDITRHHSAHPLPTTDAGDGEAEIEIQVQGEAGDEFISFGQPTTPARSAVDDRPFYGLLDEQEQAYYTDVNAKLEANDFGSPEDKAIFLDAVYRESQGKELKIASSQSCSRYLEKWIRISSAEQVRRWFGKFVGHFLQLVQHRFASHCCEALFLKAAQFVAEDKAEWEQDGGTLSLEQLFLAVVEELQPNLGYLLTERFASHVVRVLLLVLSGEPLNDISTVSVLASRKKEKIEAYSNGEESNPVASRKVPPSFHEALSRLISSSVATLDTTYIRALATHPTGNPTLQLLLRLELVSGGKSRAKHADSVLHRLLPDESLEEDSESAKFVQGLMYDPTGSRLLETIIQNAPGKMFKRLYGNLLKQRIGAMAKNDIASYVAIRVLERLSKEDLQSARDEILSEMSTLVFRNRIGIIKVLVERCKIRHVDIGPVVAALQAAYGDNSGDLLLRMLKLLPTGEIAEQPDTRQKQPEDGNVEKTADIHGSLLAQTLLQSPTAFPLIHQGLQSLSSDVLLRLAKDPSASRVLQQSLTSPCSNPQSNRKLILRFYGHMADLAMDISGSHLADVLWCATNGSHFMKERLAEELRAAEGQLRESRYGRTVWRNWHMDVYLRRPGEWQAMAKESVAEQANGEEDGTSKKSRLELARERFAEKKGRRQRLGGRTDVVPANA
ncbi:hypothetical protein EPUS_07150 [Endocarpon pusillum Z07020]|uniref:Nucleolar protein 9 n=1 Tax=Endocarpon pusillum (strain Z07020 / HMAS-L-300199) TaxID=1263415 RepID=U1FV93_ENDPU|nr:uncharacterized protein EPUS_07150 [Endocarpon pusillum Z07020]ERF68732.1 hypothetical protein EPUS_07150 [Endocarpon pusillum Z07020]